MRRLLSGVALVSLLCLGAARTDSGFNAERLARIPSAMQRFVARGDVAGIVTLVARKGKVEQVTTAGYQDLESKTPMKPDSIFQIMSMTKPVTAVGIMILVEQGKLAINDPVEKHLPEFRGQMMVDGRTGDEVKLRKPARTITIRDLMTHTSGMPGNPTSPPELYQRMNRTLAESVTLFSQLRLDFEPGTRWQYSNPGIATLGRIIEVVADQPFERFIEEQILRPLGMKDSSFFAPAAKTNRIALVYKSENGKLVRSGPGILGGDSTEFRKGAKYPAPEFAMYSTAADLAAFYQMMLNGGTYNNTRILSPESVKVMSMVHTGGIRNAAFTPGAGYGLAWEVIAEPAGTVALLSIGTYGHGGAFGTYGWIDPAKDIVGVFMAQHSGGGATDARNAFTQMVGAALE